MREVRDFSREVIPPTHSAMASTYTISNTASFMYTPIH